MDNYESEFSKKNVIITGASSGVGLYSAFYFLNQNANVILACQDEISVIKLLEKYNFKNAYILKADLEKLGQIKTFINYITEIFTSIDILINCAGIKLDNDILTTHSEDFDYTMNTNLRSVFILIKELRPYFSQGASIINMSCMYGTKPMCGFISYSMSKAGLETLTKYAAAEMAYLNIRINAISACPINTNSLRYINISEKEIKEFNKKMEKNIPLGRIAEGDDIVKVIIFLASKRSKKITGQIIKVDGGRSLTSSGYVHYKGMLNMNSRFEPDGENIKSWFQNKFNFKEKMVKEITDKNELKKFVDENINKSNFATRLYDAHISINPPYKMVDANEELLKTKYLKGNTPNELLDLKTSKQNKMSYNDGQFPIQIPETKNSLLNNRYTRNTKMENEDNNINNNYDEYGIEKKENNNINNINNFENVGMLEKNDY